MAVGFEWTTFHFEERGLVPLLRSGNTQKGYNRNVPALWAVNHRRVGKNAFKKYNRRGGVDFVVIPPQTSFTRSRNIENYLKDFKYPIWFMNFCNDRSCLDLKVLGNIPLDIRDYRAKKSNGVYVREQPIFSVQDTEIYQGKPDNEFVEAVKKYIYNFNLEESSSPLRIGYSFA